MGNGIWIGVLATMGIGFLIICFTMIFAFACSFYVLQSIGLYKMAKNLGYDSPWLAWIPFVNIYLMFILPKHSFEPLIIKTEIISRVNAFWIYMGVTFGASIISSVFSVFIEVPIFGVLCSMMVVALDLLMLFAIVIFQYPLYNDLLELFFSKESASICAIVGIIFPVALPVILFIAGKKEAHISDPVKRNYYLEKKDEL